MHYFKKLFMILVVLTILPSCAQHRTYSSTIYSPPQDNIQMNEAKAYADNIVADSVRWGGIVTSVQEYPDYLSITILELKLDENGRPMRDSVSDGRFIARVAKTEDAYYEIEIDDEITVLGQYEETITASLSGAAYDYPIVSTIEYKIWPQHYVNNVWYSSPYPYYWHNHSLCLTHHSWYASIHFGYFHYRWLYQQRHPHASYTIIHRPHYGHHHFHSNRNYIDVVVRQHRRNYMHTGDRYRVSVREGYTHEHRPVRHQNLTHRQAVVRANANRAHYTDRPVRDHNELREQRNRNRHDGGQQRNRVEPIHRQTNSNSRHRNIYAPVSRPGDRQEHHQDNNINERSRRSKEEHIDRHIQPARDKRYQNNAKPNSHNRTNQTEQQTNSTSRSSEQSSRQQPARVINQGYIEHQNRSTRSSSSSSQSDSGSSSSSRSSSSTRASSSSRSSSHSRSSASSSRTKSSSRSRSSKAKRN